MASMAGPREMHRDAGAPFGVFNLAKFRAEVASRVGIARDADASGASMPNYMKGTYDGPRTSTTSLSRLSAEQRHGDSIGSRMLRQDGDQAYEKLQQHANRQTSVSFLGSTQSTSPERQSMAGSGVIPAARSSMHLEADPLTSDGIRWNMPEKWYSLTKNSAQTQSPVEVQRHQTNRPLLGTKPSENPYSAPPTRINRFSDVFPNPRLIDGKHKKRHHDSEHSTSSQNIGIARFGHMRKCNIPFTEGWKRATFKPAKEKLVPYTGKVKNWYPGRGYGFISLAVDGQDVFVHKNDVLTPQNLAIGKSVVFEMNMHGRRGPEARKVRLADSAEVVPDGMEEEEYRDLMGRRRQDNEVRAIFATGFWKYPKSEETLPEGKGGMGLNYMPYEKDVSFERLMILQNPLPPSQAAQREAPKARLKDDGPDISAKLARRPWLARSLSTSPSRHPLSLPPCASYFTSPVVTSHDQPLAPRSQLSMTEAAARSPSRLRAALYPPPNPPLSNQSSLSEVHARSRHSLDDASL